MSRVRPLRWHPLKLAAIPLLLAVVFTTLSTGVAHAIVTQIPVHFTETISNNNGNPGPHTFSITPKSGNTSTANVSGSTTVNPTSAGNNKWTYKGTINAHLVVPGRECTNGGCQYDYQVCDTSSNSCSAFWTASNAPNPATITAQANGGGGGNGNPDAGNQSNSPECTDSNDPLSWIICPIFQAAADSSEWILNTIVTPFLLTQPIDTSASNPLYQVWSNFRLYGDIFLVIALLVLVFGQSIGGGLVDAYTVKKALPRVLVAAILVNLSIYIVAFMIDITNIIGKSIGEILIAPFKAAGSWHFTPNAAQGIGVLSIGILGYFLARGGIWTFFKSLFSGTKNGKLFTQLAGHGSFGREALTAGLLIAVPMILAILAVFVTLLIRKGLILFLVLVSPVAFALYALPNTEQYFRKWWSLLLEALMVFPIIIVIFAMADILSLTILQANSVTSQSFSTGVVQGTASFLAILVALVLQFLPLFIVPFAFRMAGGVLGRLHEFTTNASGKVANMGGYKHAREHAQQQVSDRMIQTRNQAKQDMFDRANELPTGSREQRRLRRRASWMAGRGIEQKISEVNQRKRQEQELNTGHGPDDFRRASTADKDMVHAAEHGGIEEVRRLAGAHGWVEGNDFRDAGNGAVEVASLGGKFYGAATASQAIKEFGGDQGALQYNLQYEMGKSTQTWQKQRIKAKYGAWGRSQGWGQNTSNERWIGAAYGSQQKDKDYKFFSVDEHGELTPSNALGQIQEMNSEEDQWAWGRHSAETYNELSRNVGHAADVLAWHRDEANGVPVAARRGVASHGKFTDAASAQQYMEEVGKHVDFLESPSGGYPDPETGQMVPGSAGASRILYSAAPDTSQAAQRLANMFHHRGGEYVDVARTEVADKGKAPAPGQYGRAKETYRSPTTEEGVSGVPNRDSPTGPDYPQAGQSTRSVQATRTPLQAYANPASQGGTPVNAVPGHRYTEPRPDGGVTGTGGLNSYMQGQPAPPAPQQRDDANARLRSAFDEARRRRGGPPAGPPAPPADTPTDIAA